MVARCGAPSWKELLDHADLVISEEIPRVALASPAKMLRVLAAHGGGHARIELANSCFARTCCGSGSDSLRHALVSPADQCNLSPCASLRIPILLIPICPPIPSAISCGTPWRRWPIEVAKP